MLKNTSPVDVKNAYLPLESISGVDLEKGTVTHHPDLFQPKEEMREAVIESVMNAESADQVPPIEVRLMDDGSWGIIDGYHRVTAFARYTAQNPKNDKFRRIRVSRYMGSLEEAEFASVRENFADGRSNLTPEETIKAVERFMARGYKPEEISDKLGGGANKRYVKQFSDILEKGVPALKEAVAKGHITPKTATAIARKIQPPAQAEAIAAATEAEKKGSDVKARQELGLRKAKMEIMRVNEVVSWAMTWYPQYREQRDEKSLDANLEGRFESLCAFTKMDGVSEKAQNEHFDKMHDEYEAELNRKNNADKEKAEKRREALAKKERERAENKAKKQQEREEAKAKKDAEKAATKKPTRAAADKPAKTTTAKPPVATTTAKPNQPKVAAPSVKKGLTPPTPAAKK